MLVILTIPNHQWSQAGLGVALIFFSMMFSAMLTDAFHDLDTGINIRYWTDGKLFNARRLQAGSYKERILKPREDAKRAQNEKELYRFMGPAWKGKGNVLGGKNTPKSPDTDHTNRDAAVHRQLPEHTNEVRRNIVSQLKQASSNIKTNKVTVLPDEPPDGTADSILVVLRTPVGTKHKRRFLVSNTVQVLLDFMTVIGFHQSAYTIAMSYPRQLLGSQADSTLEELGFIHQVVLNIEEIEM